MRASASDIATSKNYLSTLRGIRKGKIFTQYIKITEELVEDENFILAEIKTATINSFNKYTTMFGNATAVSLCQEYTVGYDIRSNDHIKKIVTVAWKFKIVNEYL